MWTSSPKRCFSSVIGRDVSLPLVHFDLGPFDPVLLCVAAASYEVFAESVTIALTRSLTWRKCLKPCNLGGRYEGTMAGSRKLRPTPNIPI